MKSVGIQAKDKSLLLVLENMFVQSSNIFKRDTYYYIATSFTDVPSEDRNIWINNNDWFRKSTINHKYLDSILNELEDEKEDEIVRDFIQMLYKVDLEFLEIKIFEID